MDSWTKKQFRSTLAGLFLAVVVGLASKHLFIDETLQLAVSDAFTGWAFLVGYFARKMAKTSTISGRGAIRRVGEFFGFFMGDWGPGEEDLEGTLSSDEGWNIAVAMLGLAITAFFLVFLLMGDELGPSMVKTLVLSAIASFSWGFAIGVRAEDGARRLGPADAAILIIYMAAAFLALLIILARGCAG